MLPFSPLSHLIALGLLAWLYVTFKRLAGEAELRRARMTVLGVLFAWVLVSSAIAYRGLYLLLNEEYLLLTAGPAVPLVLLTLLVLVSANVRHLLGLFVERISLESLTRVHVVRILALGTIYKWLAGDLPGHFVIPVGIPDFLIGVTALSVSRGVARDPTGNATTFAAWNVIGGGVFLLALPLIQLSQPGPLHLIPGGVRTDEVLSFPMSIVPTFVAPFLLALHVVALVKLRQQRRALKASDSSGLVGEKP